MFEHSRDIQYRTGAVSLVVFARLLNKGQFSDWFYFLDTRNIGKHNQMSFVLTKSCSLTSILYIFQIEFQFRNADFLKNLHPRQWNLLRDAYLWTNSPPSFGKCLKFNSKTKIIFEFSQPQTSGVLDRKQEWGVATRRDFLFLHFPSNLECCILIEWKMIHYVIEIMKNFPVQCRLVTKWKGKLFLFSSSFSFGKFISEIA